MVHRIRWPRSSIFRSCGCWPMATSPAVRFIGPANGPTIAISFKNCLAIGQLHALMYRDLAAHFRAGQRPLPGRQSRPANAEEGLSWRHTTTGTTFAAKSRGSIVASWRMSTSRFPMRGQPTSISTASVSTSAHGDDCRSNLGIPWYGMVRRQKGLIALDAAAGANSGVATSVVGHHHAASSSVRRGWRTVGQWVMAWH